MQGVVRMHRALFFERGTFKAPASEGGLYNGKRSSRWRYRRFPFAGGA
jgi:hypothetical protein